MKRILIIGSLFAVIFATSCKKEEMQAPVTKPQDENPLVLIKADIEEDGMIGDLYYNKYKPEQEVFVVKKMKIKLNPTGTYSEDTYIPTDDSGYEVVEIDCSGKAKDCTKKNGRIYKIKKM